MIRSIPTLAASERGVISSPQWAEEGSEQLDQGGGEEGGHRDSGSETGGSETGSSLRDSMSTVYDSALVSEDVGGNDDADQGSGSASASDLQSEYLWTEEEWRRYQEKEKAQFVAHLNPAHLQRDPRPQKPDRDPPSLE